MLTPEPVTRHRRALRELAIQDRSEIGWYSGLLRMASYAPRAEFVADSKGLVTGKIWVHETVYLYIADVGIASCTVISPGYDDLKIDPLEYRKTRRIDRKSYFTNCLLPPK